MMGDKQHDIDYKAEARAVNEGVIKIVNKIMEEHVSSILKSSHVFIAGQAEKHREAIEEAFIAGAGYVLIHEEQNITPNVPEIEKAAAKYRQEKTAFKIKEHN